MKRPNITPGPWISSNQLNGSKEEYPEWMRTSIHTKENSPWYICAMEDAEDEIANTRAIASLPDLLETLESMEQFLECGMRCADYDATAGTMLLEVRAALTKAGYTF